MNPSETDELPDPKSSPGPSPEKEVVEIAPDVAPVQPGGEGPGSQPPKRPPTTAFHALSPNRIDKAAWVN
jgi:hypothetical protein